MAETYFVTGASGFIGKRLVRALLAPPSAHVFYLMRDPAPEKLAALEAFWGEGASRAKPLKGDLLKAALGLSAADRKKLRGRVDHFFHLAAIYDLAAEPELEKRTNVEGARRAVELAEAIGAKRFHHMSSIAAAGLYDGVFREDMFAEADHLDHPYFASKHEAERVVREECATPWRIYRPGLVVGDSRNGEIDKIDGPYYFFKLIQKMRKMLPPWAPTIGFEGGRLNLVPVDFVVAALVHIAHVDGQDRRCFHLTDPNPHRVGDILNIFARAAHAPQMSLRLNVALFNLLPKGLMRGLGALTPVRRIRKAVMKDLGLPDDVLRFLAYPTRFDQREAERLLKDAGIEVPDLESYAWRLWDYWERHLDPDLFIDRSLHSKVAGKVVVVTGGSAGIGKSVALKVAEAGAKTIIVARDKEKLDAACGEAAEKGLEFLTYEADIADAGQCEALIEKISADHGGVDILVNNAGRSIRRAIENSYDRFHDYERVMQLNYFGALRLTLGFLAGMAQRRSGHVVNVSSIGVLTNAPRFSAYVASKAALEAWTRCAASEFLDRGVHFTTINMPLVRTEMIAPTKLYKQVPMLSPEEAADLVVEAIVHQPIRIATRLGIFGEVVHAIAPRIGQIVMNTSFRMFPESAAARGAQPGAEMPTADQLAFTQLLKGLHF
jgi:NAD(P)-dependent dehydrogenase (short-subunit alcohol dehydrogenase family)